jgi:hypothetical protein
MSEISRYPPELLDALYEELVRALGPGTLERLPNGDIRLLKRPELTDEFRKELAEYKRLRGKAPQNDDPDSGTEAG